MGATDAFFNAVDRNRDGKITREEFQQNLAVLGSARVPVSGGNVVTAGQVNMAQTVVQQEPMAVAQQGWVAQTRAVEPTMQAVMQPAPVMVPTVVPAIEE